MKGRFEDIENGGLLWTKARKAVPGEGMISFGCFLKELECDAGPFSIFLVSREVAWNHTGPIPRMDPKANP